MHTQYKIQTHTHVFETMGSQADYGAEVLLRRVTTSPVIMRWFLIQIAYNIGNVVQTDLVVRTNGLAGRLRRRSALAPPLEPTRGQCIIDLAAGLTDLVFLLGKF